MLGISFGLPCIIIIHLFLSCYGSGMVLGSIERVNMKCRSRSIFCAFSIEISLCLSIMNQRPSDYMHGVELSRTPCNSKAFHKTRLSRLLCK